MAIRGKHGVHLLFVLPQHISESARIVDEEKSHSPKILTKLIELIN